MIWLSFLWLIFTPSFGFIDISIAPIFIGAIFKLSLMKKFPISLFKNPYFNTLILFSFINLVYSFIISSANGSPIATEFMFKPVRMIIIIISLGVIFHSTKNMETKILYFLTFLGVFNGFFVYFQYVFHYLDISPMIVKHPEFANNVITPYRKPGLSNGYPTAGFVACISAFLSIFQYTCAQKKSTWLLIFFFTLPSVFLTARTTMLIFIMLAMLSILILSWLIPLLNQKIKAQPFSFFKSTSRSLIIVGISSTLSIFAWNNMDEKTKGTFDIMFELFINYAETGKLSTYSSNDLIENHYKLPEDAKTWAFGNGYAPFSEPESGKSDVSFVRLLYGNGAFAVAIYLLLFIYTVFLAMLAPGNLEYKMAILLIHMAIFIMCIKGPYLFSRFIGDIQLIIAVYHSVQIFQRKTSYET